MRTETEFCCKIMKISVEDNVIIYSPKVKEHSIMVKSDSEGFDVIHNIYSCPFLGSKFPTSLRDMWFDKLEKLGYDNLINIY